MNKKVKTTLIIILVVISLAWAGLYLKSLFNLENAVKDYEEAMNKLGYVKKEPVYHIAVCMNVETMNSGFKNILNHNNSQVSDGTYWYDLTENILMFIEPENMTESDQIDIAEYTGIYANKKGYDEELTIKYAKALIKANNSEITDEEADNLISEAKHLASEKLAANNGKGVYVGYLETEDHYEIQVQRIFNELKQ